MMDKHHIVYRTTNLLNRRYYIGIHTTSNIDDGYLGSGRRLKAEIKKYGVENFERAVIDTVPSRQELLIKEAELVTEALRQDPLCLNLKNGGEGGWEHLNDNSDVQRAKGIKGNAAMKKLRQEDPEWRAKNSAKTTAGLLRAYADGTRTPNQPNWTGRKHRQEAKDKMAVSAIGKHEGAKNSQYGTCWVTNGVAIKIKKQDLDSYLHNGYIRGRTKPC